MYCQHCGNKISENAKFCESCGKPININNGFNTNSKPPQNEVVSITNTLHNQSLRNGRMRRSTYIANLVLNLIALFISIVFLILLLTAANVDYVAMGFLFVILYLTIAIWHVYITVYRLHDINQSGWLSFLIFVPLANLILTAILIFKKGDAGTNIYGPSPIKKVLT